MPSYKVNDDMGLFLVTFERTCERNGLALESWPQQILTVLPGEATEIIARLTKDESEDYQKVKAALLRKYRLSAEAFRRHFREAVRTPGESFQDFSYKLKANLIEWLKGEDAFGCHDKVVELICKEQFYGSLSEEMRLWIQDRSGEKDLERAAVLADEFAARRESEKTRVRPLTKFSKEENRRPFHNEKAGSGTKDVPTDNLGQNNSAAKDEKKTTRALEATKPVVCFRCQEPGHLAIGCRKPRIVFSFVNGDDDNLALLAPYLRDLVVNGIACKVLRDSAATMDIVHPAYVKPEDFTGECAWIRQVVEENSVCLPIANVNIEGPFGLLRTEAAVSQNLSEHYPYLFSNRSEMLLKKKGLSFGDHTVQALTRSKAREIAAKMKHGSEARNMPHGIDTQEAQPLASESSEKGASEEEYVPEERQTATLEP
ncbi:uncharacterized protein LOC125942676 [Dermacentor silvarum]|uniref:uncharacterized protein LOC125942676 n=1 Tax=Dermacentor silvarum TaxID=543639 RepID=UPI00210185EB|nr:uncharacterized protein LOC125942676 [Dermacentor silvarum]